MHTCQQIVTYTLLYNIINDPIMSTGNMYVCMYVNFLSE